MVACPRTARDAVDVNIRLRLSVAIVTGYVVVTAIMVSSFFDYHAIGQATYVGDARLMVWTLAWDNHAILSGLPLFDANTFYPAHQALAFTDHLFGLSLFTLPVYAATDNAVLAYNIVWWVSHPLCCLGAYALARRYTKDRLAAFVAGLAYAFTFFRMLHGHGHIGLIWVFWLPLSLLALARWHDRPTWTRLAAFVVTVVLQALTSWYLAVMVLLATGLLLAWLVLLQLLPNGGGREPATAKARAGGDGTRSLAQLTTALVVGALCLWPFARHYESLAAASPRELTQWSAHFWSYLVPPENTWLGRWLVNRDIIDAHWIFGEQTLFLGFIATSLAAVGTILVVRSAVLAKEHREHQLELAFFPVLGMIGVLLSLGPGAAIVHDWSPFSLLAWLPGVSSFRVPARFSLLACLSLAILAAVGAEWLHRRFGRLGRVATLVLIPIMLGEWYVVGFPLGKPRPESIPPIYRYLASLPAGPVVSLPTYRNRPDWYLGADYLWYSTSHWRPIVNGYGRGEPENYFSEIGHMDAFAGPNSAITMRRLGIRYVVLHSSRYPDGAVEILSEALYTTDYTLIGRFGDDYLFRVEP